VRTSSALFIARPLLAELATRPFSGQVWGIFGRACNLVDDRQRVITIALREVGNGPFSILIEGQPGLFDRLTLGQPALGNHHILTIGDWRIALYEATTWEPQMTRPGGSFKIEPVVAKIIRPYANWPSLAENDLVAGKMGRVAREATAQLTRAITHNGPVEEAVGRLAGLGSGLTPAGDDYLVGVAAALWLTGQVHISKRIVETAIPKTTALSAAFLKAAAAGEFTEPWHVLAEALFKVDLRVVNEAVNRLVRLGASSGQDALAGFAATILNNNG
jgi:hypothetical protein